MTKEYHIYTNKGANYEQGFVFEVDRTEDHSQVIFTDLWFILGTNEGHLKTRLQLGKMIQNIVDTVGGNVDSDSIPELIDVFKDIIPEDKMDELKIDELNRDTNKATTISADILIKLSELLKNEENTTGTAHGEQ